MSAIESMLPSEFSALNPLVAEWAISSEQGRAVKRVGSPIEELRKFHATVYPRLDDIIHYLNTFPNDPAALPADARRLYDLALMAMEAAAPIDLGWNQPDIEDVFPMERFAFHNDEGA